MYFTEAVNYLLNARVSGFNGVSTSTVVCAWINIKVNHILRGNQYKL
jgi:hypothetical protein